MIRAVFHNVSSVVIFQEHPVVVVADDIGWPVIWMLLISEAKAGGQG
jgi:hypothetical protein